MITLRRTDSYDPVFRSLVKELDMDLQRRDGDDHSFFAQFNKIDAIRHAIVALKDGEPVGCGAIKRYDDNTMEVKRMFVPVDFRGQGIATLILQELERWCREINIHRCILETGERQPEAIRLYQKNNYNVIPNFGQYADVATSVCFEKSL